MVSSTCLVCTSCAYARMKHVDRQVGTGMRGYNAWIAARVQLAQLDEHGGVVDCHSGRGRKLQQEAKQHLHNDVVHGCGTLLCQALH